MNRITQYLQHSHEPVVTEPPSPVGWFHGSHHKKKLPVFLLPPLFELILDGVSSAMNPTTNIKLMSGIRKKVRNSVFLMLKRNIIYRALVMAK